MGYVVFQTAIKNKLFDSPNFYTWWWKKLMSFHSFLSASFLLYHHGIMRTISPHLSLSLFLRTTVWQRTTMTSRWKAWTRCWATSLWWARRAAKAPALVPCQKNEIGWRRQAVRFSRALGVDEIKSQRREAEGILWGGCAEGRSLRVLMYQLALI